MKLCLALDLPTKAANLALCESLAENLTQSEKDKIYLKVGLRAFIRDGAAFVAALEGLGFGVFLDLKLYDIPNTMLDALNEAANLGVKILTIHASSGRVAMRSLAECAKTLPNPPLIFAVTALTSFEDAVFSEIYGKPIESSALTFAQIAAECGIDGVVCSVWEAQKIKEKFPLLALTPAIRPVLSDFALNLAAKNPQNNAPNLNPAQLYAAKDDQSRTSSIAEAKAAGSDFVVIGRPIYTVSDPAAFTKAILGAI